MADKTKTTQPRLKVSLTDFATIVGIHLPTLRILYPQIEEELQGLIEEGHDTGIDFEGKIPGLLQAVETLKEINRLITT